jgi:hypothetical protein
MSITFYHIMHLAALLALVAGTFYGFAGAPQTRGKVLAVTGIAALLMLISGVGMIHKSSGAHSFGQPWVWVKLVAWLGVAGLAGMGYRQRGKAGLFMAVIAGLLFAAIYAVYTKLA